MRESVGECRVSELVKGKLVIGSSHPCSEHPDNLQLKGQILMHGTTSPQHRLLTGPSISWEKRLQSRHEHMRLVAQHLVATFVVLQNHASCSP